MRLHLQASLDELTSAPHYGSGFAALPEEPHFHSYPSALISSYPCDYVISSTASSNSGSSSHFIVYSFGLLKDRMLTKTTHESE